MMHTLSKPITNRIAWLLQAHMPPEARQIEVVRTDDSVFLRCPFTVTADHDLNTEIVRKVVDDYVQSNPDAPMLVNVVFANRSRYASVDFRRMK